MSFIPDIITLTGLVIVAGSFVLALVALYQMVKHVTVSFDDEYAYIDGWDYLIGGLTVLTVALTCAALGATVLPADFIGYIEGKF